ncbi:universal stress protein [Kribbella sp. NPDC002412]
MKLTESRGLVVALVDASPIAGDVIGQGFEAAQELGTELILLHIPTTTDPRTWDTISDAPWYRPARQLVTTALNGWPDKFPDVVFRTHYRLGDPTEVLAGYAQIADQVVTANTTESLHPRLVSHR